MRKIILYINSTFNGVVTGDPKKDKTNWMDWATKASFGTGSEYLLKAMDTVDTLLLGRGTYEDLVRKWPSMNASQLGKKINNAHKLVVTGDRPLNELRWGKFEAPRQLTGNNIEEQIKDVKDSEGGDIMIFGSPILVQSLTNANLIDEYQIKVHPVVVNVGEHLFDNLKAQKDFRLVDVQALKDGSILVTYAPAKAK